MEVKLVKEQVQQIFGKLVYIGSEPIYTYDRQEKKRTDNVEATRLHLGSSKQGKSLNIRMESVEPVQIESFAEVELGNLILCTLCEARELCHIGRTVSVSKHSKYQSEKNRLVSYMCTVT